MAVSGPAFSADIQGSADHPLVPRYKGSEIVAYDVQAYAQKAFARAVIKAGALEENPDAVLKLEGKHFSITYRAPENRSALEVARNYQAALEAGGFSVVFTCSQAECGGRNFNHAMSPRHYYLGFGEYYADQQYTLARLERSEGDVYVSLYAVFNKSGGGPDRNRSLIQVDLMELKPMENRMVVLKAEEMGGDLASDGRVALYGILFDVDKDTMRADSKPQLEEIAKLLKSHSSLRVLIVGHTDAQGGLEYNQDLSMRRARSIVRALAQDYGIKIERMTPQGVGMASPVASNRTEQGRAKNRRVELVDIAR
ncbi:DUF4892 domain-containing protein [Bordetella petrii]|nr:DUF4892 domain-containing protein [Bordetella petrii]